MKDTVCIVVSYCRDRLGPRLWPQLGCHFLPQSSPSWRGHKNWPALGLNFKFIYRDISNLLTSIVQNPPLKVGVVSYKEYKNHILIFS